MRFKKGANSHLLEKSQACATIAPLNLISSRCSCILQQLAQLKHSSLKLLYYYVSTPCVSFLQRDILVYWNEPSGPSWSCDGEDGALSTHLLFFLNTQCSEREFCLHVMFSLLQCMQFKIWNSCFLLDYLDIRRHRLSVCSHFTEVFRFPIFVSCHMAVLISDPRRENHLICIWELLSSE